MGSNIFQRFCNWFLSSDGASEDRQADSGTSATKACKLPRPITPLRARTLASVQTQRRILEANKKYRAAKSKVKKVK
jgi:hypothetical protein